MHSETDMNSIDGQGIERFEYFESPEFCDWISHYEYIMQKYLYDYANFQMNISGSLRRDADRMFHSLEPESPLKCLLILEQNYGN